MLLLNKTTVKNQITNNIEFVRVYLLDKHGFVKLNHFVSIGLWVFESLWLFSPPSASFLFSAPSIFQNCFVLFLGAAVETMNPGAPVSSRVMALPAVWAHRCFLTTRGDPLNPPALGHLGFRLPDDLWLVVQTQQTNVGSLRGLSSLRLLSLH